MIASWDILTGSVDRGRPCRTGRFYRPEWLHDEYSGITLAMEASPNREFLALGSEDGYMFIYSTETGLPRGGEKPSSKHSAEVWRGSWFSAEFKDYLTNESREKAGVL